MSHFYGVISDSARKNAPTARGHHGITVEAQSFQGKIVTTLSREKDGDGNWVDGYEVWREPHQGSGGERVLLAKGRIDQPLIAMGANGRVLASNNSSDDGHTFVREILNNS